MIAWSKKFSPEALLSHFCQKNQFDNIRHRETIGIHVDPLAEMGITIWYPYGSYGRNG